MSRFSLLRHLLASAGGALPVVYDNRFGTAVDANGMFTFDLNQGVNRRIWLNGLTGSDTNNGFSDATAKATWTTAFNTFIGAGFTPGDQLMVANGSTYVDHFAAWWAGKGSGSTTYPTAVLCYDHADPTNAAKYGKLTGLDQPVLQLAANASSLNLNGVSPTGRGGYAVQGIYIDGSVSPNASGLSVGSINRTDQFVIQNCHLKAFELKFDNGGFSNGQATTINVSKCAFLAPFTNNANTSGLYTNGNDNLWVQDNVFIHCGWKLYGSRDDSVTVGGAGTQAHAIYYHAGQVNGRFDRNVYMDSAVDGLGVRGSATLTQPLCIDETIVGNMTAFSAAWGSGGSAEQPGGAIATLDDFVFVGGADINTANPRGAGVSAANAQPTGSYINNGVAFDNSRFGITGAQNQFFAITEFSSPAQQNQGFALSNIRLHNYATYAQGLWFAPGTMSQLSVTWTNCLVDALTAQGNTGAPSSISGSGVRAWISADYPNAINKAQFITAMGFASKAAMANAMWTRPDLHWSQAAHGIALPAFGLTPIYSTAAIPDMTGIAVEAIYRTALVDLTLSATPVRGTAQTVYFLNCSANFALSSSDLPSGFSLVGTTLTYDGTGSGAFPAFHILETNNDGLGTHTTAFSI